MNQIELHGGVAHDGFEVPSHMRIDFTLVIGKPFVDEVFQKLEIPVTNPDLEDPHLFQSRHQVDRDFPIPLQQEAVGIVGIRDWPGQDHSRLDSADGNSKHRTTFGARRTTDMIPLGIPALGNN